MRNGFVDKMEWARNNHQKINKTPQIRMFNKINLVKHYTSSNFDLMLHGGFN